MKIELSVAYVKFGGNTGGDEYFYAFNPPTIFAEGKNCELDFGLTDGTGEEFEIVDVIGSDGGDELASAEIRDSGRSAKSVDANSRKQVISVSVVIRDTKRRKLINCDPQVLNSPNPW